MLKSIIVDDEERGIDALGELIRTYCPGLQVAATATDIDAAATLIRQHRPDILFLDIAMPGGNGFQLLERLEQIDFGVVFVTAYHEYAVRALRFSALDYLLKPVSVDELQQAVQRFRNRHEQVGNSRRYAYLKETLAEGNPFHKIVLSTTTGYYFVKIADIVYCEADENYTHFFMDDGARHTASRPLKEFEELLERQYFFRIHKSYLINLNQVSFVNKDAWVVMSNRKELPVSSRKRTEFFSLLKGMRPS